MNGTPSTLVRERGSVEYFAYDFDTMTVGGEPVDPPTNYQLALNALNTYPTEDDWHDAPWLAGPLTPGDYMLRLRFTDTPEQPSIRVAVVTVL